MQLNETNQFIKDNLQNILHGKFDEKFSPEQLKMMLECSFLYNHITSQSDSILFKYNDTTLKVSGIDYLMPYSSEDEILSIIRNDNAFISAYKSFLRNKKIEDILK